MNIFVNICILKIRNIVGSVGVTYHDVEYFIKILNIDNIISNSREIKNLFL